MNRFVVRQALLAGACSMVLAGAAPAQTDVPDNAQSLMEAVKRRTLDRQIAARKTDLDRLAEDLVKGQKEAADMQANVEATAKLVKESGVQLEKLQGNKKRLEQVLELTKLRIEAEMLKTEGLKMLGEAQIKALAALARHSEETNLRVTLGEADLKELSPAAAEPAAEPPSGKAPPDKSRPTLADLRKKLTALQASAEAADKLAHEAMRAAAAKLELANIANGKAKRRSATVEGDIPPIADKPLDLEEKAAGE